jgi:Ca2+-binding RTX toxin-like protein
MTLKHYNTSFTGGATYLIDLGTTDSAVIGKDALISNIENDGITLLGSGSNQSVTVYGTLESDSGPAISLGAAGQMGDGVTIAAAGLVRSQGGTAIDFFAAGSSLSNAGKIDGGVNGVTITLNENSSETFSATNSGKIIGGNYGILMDSGSQGFNLTNSGTIKGPDSFFGYYCYGDQTIINTGKMIGGISFGQGDDKYDGHAGTITGVIEAGAGNDRIIGGAEDDVIAGSIGRDILTGNGGADQFFYSDVYDSSVTATGRDLIKDFSQNDGDRIDLHAFDANSLLPNQQSFKFIGAATFDGHAGELHYAFASGHTFISGDLNGDSQADFKIELGTHVALHKGDFIL